MAKIVWQAWAIDDPIRPNPTIPIVFSRRSCGRFLYRIAKFPFRTSESMRKSCLKSARISASACSATEVVLTPMLEVTMIPCSVAAGMSTLSTPAPVREIIISSFGYARSSRVILIPVRRTIARASFISGPTISGFGALAVTNRTPFFSRTPTASASIGWGSRTVMFSS